jgi:hypothetical protein
MPSRDSRLPEDGDNLPSTFPSDTGKPEISSFSLTSAPNPSVIQVEYPPLPEIEENHMGANGNRSEVVVDEFDNLVIVQF